MDFSLILFQALIVTGSIVLANRLIVGPRVDQEYVARSLLGRIAMVVVDYSRAFFPVILVVFALRSFVVEPFRIPSGSMLPTLVVGDFILVNKFKYGIRLPIVDFKVPIEIGRPARGDVMVFRYPRDISQHFIKRVIGLPGDTITYEQKRLRVNGKFAGFNEVERDERRSKGQTLDFDEYTETIDGSTHHVVIDPRTHPRRNRKWDVPPGKYLVMGDNRDASNDSRGWGFVPEKYIVGHAFFVWFSWDSGSWFKVNWSRIGHVIQ